MTDKLIASVQGFADEDHVRKTSERTWKAHRHKFQKGYSVGGRVFGYRNVHIYDGVDQHGNRKRSHTVLGIDPVEAPVVRRIFELYDSGVGVKGIAKRLNSERAPYPKPFNRKDPTKVQPVPGWSPSTLRSMLRREIYRGVVVWNRTRKRDEWFQKNQKRRPKEEQLRVSAPHLRIIPEELWNRVASRRADTAILESLES